MDWPLAGIVTGIVVLTGAAAYGVVGVIQSDAPPQQKAAKSAGPALVPKSALPIYVPPSEPREQFSDATPLISLSSPPGAFQFDKPPPPPEPGPVASPVKTARPTPPVAAQPPPRGPKSTSPAAGPSAMMSVPAPQPAPAAVQWRVVATANASYFNLGGHIDKAGIVDSLATGHLRDAFKEHRNFSNLPPDIKTHILTQNISLPKIAPYRALLGIDDKKIEQEQAVRFERVGGPRGSG